MGLRFRRSLKLAPGVRMNFSASGMGMSFGVPGARVSVGPRGVTHTAGMPGTGLSWTTTTSGRAARPRSSAAQEASTTASLALKDDGTIELRDAETDSPLPAQLVKHVLDQPKIREWLQSQCNHWNQGIEGLLSVHLDTPPPERPASYTPVAFSEAPPPAPVPRPIGLLGQVFAGRRQRIEAENATAEHAHRVAYTEWDATRSAHERAEFERARRVERAHAGEADAMQDLLGARLTEIAWPRETLVSFEVAPDGHTVMLDVDLPEIESMPTQHATPAARELRVLVKARSQTQRQREYMIHVHGICFRVIGEAFATLPSVAAVVVSAFSQRPAKATGQVEDEYLISACVERSAWERINFQRLADIDLPTCFEQFELRRKMTKSGVFSPIEPLGGVS